MKRKYKINLSQSCYAIESTRIRLGSKIFHSRNYNRKINCNSYTISFQSENKVEFGEILYFIKYKNNPPPTNPKLQITSYKLQLTTLDFPDS